MRTYFTYKLKYAEDNIHFWTPFDVELDTLTWISTDMEWVCQNWDVILAYLEYTSNDEQVIRAAINSDTIKFDYQVVEKTVEEAKAFIDLTYGSTIKSNIIVWDTVTFEVEQLNTFDLNP